MPGPIIAVAARAWGSAAGACFIVLVTLVSVQLLTQERWSWHTALDMPLAFSLVFAVVSAVVHVPVFLFLPRIAGGTLTIGTALVTAVALAPVTPLAISVWVGERWDFQNLAGASIPFALAGMVFAVVWTRASRR